MVDRQFNSKIKLFQSDMGGEYHKLTYHFTKMAFHTELHVLAHVQNGSGERKTHHIIVTRLTVVAQQFMRGPMLNM